MNDDLIIFVRERLDETEWIAEAAARTSGAEWTTVGLQSAYDARMDNHIAHHHPAQVLRQVQAHREILEWAIANQAPGATIGDRFWFPVLRIARIYADHPRCREEWR